jgi:hypothetical protein
MPGLVGPRRAQPFTCGDLEVCPVRFRGDRQAGAPNGGLVGDDPALSVRTVQSFSQRAWTGTDRSTICHLSFGSFDAEAAAGINLIDVLAHGWDMSPLQGRSFCGRDDLWQIGLECARALIGPARDGRHYGPEIVPASDASAQERFLAFLGRR